MLRRMVGALMFALIPVDSLLAEDTPMHPVTTSSPVTVQVVGKGGHLTTRAHNRHLVFHAPTAMWYAFVGTAEAIVKKAPGANALFTSRDGRSWKLRHTFCHGYGTSSSQDALLVGR